MILEGLVTTANPDGSPHLAPMGPTRVDDSSRLIFRPFSTSTTGQNLLREREGVFHVTDDVLLLAKAAVNRVDLWPEYRAADQVRSWRIIGAQRAFEFRVLEADATGERMRLDAEIVLTHEGPPWAGFNRARHGILELAITATRLEWLPADEVEQAFKSARTLVAKTGGPVEREALEFLEKFIREMHPAAEGWDA